MAIVFFVTSFACTARDPLATHGRESAPREDPKLRNLATVLKEVEATAAMADRAAAEKDFVRANQLALAALKSLGTPYDSPDLIDETGRKLVLAEDEDRKGSLSGAFAIRRRVLETRIELTKEMPAP